MRYHLNFNNTITIINFRTSDCYHIINNYVESIRISNHLYFFEVNLGLLSEILNHKRKLYLDSGRLKMDCQGQKVIRYFKLEC